MPHPERPPWHGSLHGSGLSAPPGGPALVGLGHALSSALEQADLREVLRKSVQIGALTGTVALPRQIVAAGGSGRALHGLQLVVDFVGGPVPGSQPFALVLPVEQAAGLVDRLLGGTGQLGIAASVGALAEAECGVLAYLAARCCAALGTGQRVADVSCATGEALAARWPRAILWPMRMANAELTLDLYALFAEPASCPAQAIELTVLVSDELAREALAELQVGDLLVSDCWLLSATTRGLEGTVELRIGGCDERLRGVLAGDRLSVLDGRLATPSSAELRLATLTVSFAQLAALVSGCELRLEADALDASVLYLAGEPVLTGCLVQYASGVGLQVRRVYSTR